MCVVRRGHNILVFKMLFPIPVAHTLLIIKFGSLVTCVLIGPPYSMMQLYSCALASRFIIYLKLLKIPTLKICIYLKVIPPCPFFKLKETLSWNAIY